MLEPRIVAALRAIVGPPHVHIGPAELIAYSYDGTFQQFPPDVAVTPANTAEVAAILALASQENLPIIPRGAGTNLAGATVPIGGGLVLSLARMNRILDIDPVNAAAVVEPGVVTAQLQAAVEKVGLFYPPDPSSLNQSTLGGNVACNAGGPRCLKYGVTKDYVLGMTVVLASGDVLRCGGKLLKNVTGYQLAQLFVGSEGTLGVICQIVLRLLPLASARSTALAVFPRIEDASETVTAIMVNGLLPVALELMDGTTINVVEDFLGLGLPRAAEALLILEQDGNDPTAVASDLQRMAEICRSKGAAEVRTATATPEREALWSARRAVSPALGRRAPNKLGEDIVVPRGQVPAMIRRIRQIGDTHHLLIPVFGHAGDGNLHPNILFDRREANVMVRVECAAADIFTAALDLGGTLSGEHGIGSLKREFLADDVGPLAVGLMREIKRVFDPQGLLNPHKVFPERTAAPRDGFLITLPSLEGLV